MAAQIEKPRVRVPHNNVPTSDSFVNFAARLGLGAQNQFSAGHYDFNFITRNRVQMEAMYRTSWIVGQAVDVVAEDMTREGIEVTGDIEPDEKEDLQGALGRLAIWKRVNETIKWSRLYGGAIAVMLIDGQKVNTPLRPETIKQGQFRGLLVLDRWLINPTLNDLVTEFGPDLGQPKFYDVLPGAPALQGQRVHYSRVIRMDGLELPYWQKMAENGWGQSVIERLYDRLLAFDSSSQGAAQLVFKAHLRTIKVEGLRDVIAAGGKPLEGLLKQFEMIRLLQSNEGLTLLDAKDTFEAHQYGFAGLSDLLLQFGQQLSGALQIPLVRLFGQSPAGLNSTGDSDIRNYYDNISAQQEDRLRRPFGTLLDVLHRSVLGREPDKSFNFEFNPLWQMSDKEKAEIATSVSTAVTNASDAGLIGRQTALKELKQSSQVTGVFSNITDEEIEEAETDPPAPSETDPLDPEEPEPKPDDQND